MPSAGQSPPQELEIEEKLLSKYGKIATSDSTHDLRVKKPKSLFWGKGIYPTLSTHHTSAISHILTQFGPRIEPITSQQRRNATIVNCIMVRKLMIS